jgi:hypothetical protein
MQNAFWLAMAMALVTCLWQQNSGYVQSVQAQAAAAAAAAAAAQHCLPPKPKKIGAALGQNGTREIVFVRVRRDRHPSILCIPS